MDLPPVVITDDRGGDVSEYYKRARQFEREGRLVIIDGRCASACTFYLRARTCGTDRAYLKFHAARHKKTKQPSILSTTLLFNSYPDKIQQWIRNKGGLSPRWLTLRPPKLFKLIRKCTRPETAGFLMR